jgi:hypothetical protein
MEGPNSVSAVKIPVSGWLFSYHPLTCSNNNGLWEILKSIFRKIQSPKEKQACGGVGLVMPVGAWCWLGG